MLTTSSHKTTTLKIINSGNVLVNQCCCVQSPGGRSKLVPDRTPTTLLGRTAQHGVGSPPSQAACSPVKTSGVRDCHEENCSSDGVDSGGKKEQYQLKLHNYIVA